MKLSELKFKKLKSIFQSNQSKSQIDLSGVHNVEKVFQGAECTIY